MKCMRWCAGHDDEIGQCVSEFVCVDLAVEGEAAQMSLRLETSPDGPVIVAFSTGGSGVTMTAREGADVAVALWRLAVTGLSAA